MSHRDFDNGVLRDRTATRTIEVNQVETIRQKVTFGNHTSITGPVSFISFEEARARLFDGEDDTADRLEPPPNARKSYFFGSDELHILGVAA